MQFSMSVLTEREILYAAFFRLSPFADCLDAAVRPLPCPKWEILQVLFKDIPPTRVTVGRVSKGKFGRVIQVGVGLPAKLRLLPADDPELVDACAASIMKAVKALKLTKDLTNALLERVESARSATRSSTSAMFDRWTANSGGSSSGE